MRALRPEGVMPRAEWQGRAAEFCARGQQLPQSKLLDLEVIEIRSAVRQRENLRQHIRDQLSNEALARKHKVSVRTVERVVSYGGWGHIV